MIVKDLLAFTEQTSIELRRLFFTAAIDWNISTEELLKITEVFAPSHNNPVLYAQAVLKDFLHNQTFYWDRLHILRNDL